MDSVLDDGSSANSVRVERSVGCSLIFVNDEYVGGLLDPMVMITRPKDWAQPVRSMLWPQLYSRQKCMLD